MPNNNSQIGNRTGVGAHAQCYNDNDTAHLGFTTSATLSLFWKK